MTLLFLFRIFSVKGRECNTHNDCSSLQYTSCVKDLDDEKLRCLCGDNKAPFNGGCSATLKGNELSFRWCGTKNVLARSV